MNKNNFYIGLIIIILALGVGLYAHYPALVDKYNISPDARLNTYWFYKFQDEELFLNNLTVPFAKYLAPWGYIILFYFFTQWLDPLLFGHILTIILFAVTALYLYKLLKHIHSPFAGILGSLTFIATPYYLQRMTGGLPRTFAFPLLVMFLYFLIKREYYKTALVLILQCLFYPIVFMVSIWTYLLTFFPFCHRQRVKELSVAQKRYLVLIVIICGGLLLAKYLRAPDPVFSKMFTRQDMVGMQEFYGQGRWHDLLPMPSLATELKKHFMAGDIIADKAVEYSDALPWATTRIKSRIILLLVLLFLLIEALRKKMNFPWESAFMLFASALMYLGAYQLLFMFFIPNRYIRFSVPLGGLIFFSLALAQLTLKIRIKYFRRFLQAVLILLLCFHFRLDPNRLFLHPAHNKVLYDYLAELPKGVVIAAHPYIADNIHVFAKRNVFIDHAAALPIYVDYWQMVHQRTFDFFEAYYARDLAVIDDFCKTSKIDYWVVDRRHFEKDYLNKKEFYMEPFNSYVAQMIRIRTKFVLNEIPQESRLFENGSLFVVDCKSLGKF